MSITSAIPDEKNSDWLVDQVREDASDNTSRDNTSVPEEHGKEYSKDNPGKEVGKEIHY
jgi:hypothetical protein